MKTLYLTLALLVACIDCPAQAQPASDPAPEDQIDILFIGNSYTGGWGDEARGRPAAKAGGVQGIVQTFAESRGKSVYSQRSLRGGTALHEHLDDGTRVVDALESRAWDIVVLQEYSTLPTRKGDGTHGTTEDFFAGVQEFEQVIHERHPDARIVLFETWAQAEGSAMYPKYIPDAASMTADLQKNYAHAASLIDADVAPVGTAWALSLEMRPDLLLHVEDLAHPRATGTYLAALVIYATLFDEDPRGLPALATVSEEDAAYLQEVAWQAVQLRREQQQVEESASATR